MSDHRIAALLNSYLQGTIGEKEKEELAQWILGPGNAEQLNELLEQSWESYQPGQSLPAAKAEAVLQSILHQPRSGQKQGLGTGKVYSLVRTIAIAASLLILVGAGIYFLFFNKSAPTTDQPVANVKYDIPAPKVMKAMIQLADGRMVALDEINSGTLATQGQQQVVKNSDGSIVYQGEALSESYNTITNPRGSKVVSLTLPDGTKVWLNAGTIMKYFTGTSGKQRKVDLNGEAYFEVAKNPAKPFLVQKGGMSVEVLGTHFNVNAYDDDQDAKITLLEGKVQVSASRGVGTTAGVGILSPGQQASVLQNSAVVRLKKVDPTEAVAWKNGEFLFDEGTDIHNIMRQLSRWYNVEVEIKGTINSTFWGAISRDANVSEVLSMLEKTGAARFTIEGNKVTVKP